MKRSLKLIAMLLTLITVFSLLPTVALAETTDSATKAKIYATCYTNREMKNEVGVAETKVVSAKSITVDNKTFGTYIKFGGKIYEFHTIEYGKKYQSCVVLKDGKDSHEVNVCYVPHTHKYTQRHDRIYHWDGCACGSIINKERHVDPATDADSICTCGYEFSHDANLVTLWLSNMVLEPRFNRDITEYNAAVYTYKKVTSTEVRVRTNDALATVVKPTDVSIKKGMNVFQVTVTAEDCKTTKTYTVYAYLPSTVDGMEISSGKVDGNAATMAAPQANCKKRVASVALTDGIAQEMAAQAKENQSAQVVLAPTFSKWANDTLKVTVSAAGLKALAESKADLVIQTWQGDVTVPNAELGTIAAQGDSIELNVIFKDGPLKCSVTADGKDVDSSKIIAK